MSFPPLHITKVVSRYNFSEKESTLIGTGSIISIKEDELYVLTCAHVILDQTAQLAGYSHQDCDIEVLFSIDDIPYKVSVVEWIPTISGDLALLVFAYDGVTFGDRLKAIKFEDYSFAEGQHFTVKGYPNELGHNYDELSGKEINNIPTPDNIFPPSPDRKIDEILKVRFPGNVYQGYSGGSISTEKEEHLGILSFYTPNSQEAGYCIPGHAINEVFREYIADNQDDYYTVLIISPLGHSSKLKKELIRTLNSLEFGHVKRRYKFTFKSIANSNDTYYQLKRLSSQIDIILFEITDDSEIHDLWERCQGFGFLYEYMTQNSSKVAFLNWNVSRDTFNTYKSKFVESIEENNPSFSSDSLDLPYTVIGNTEILETLGFNYNKLVDERPEHDRRKHFAYILNDINDQFSFGIDTQQFEKSLLNLDFIIQKNSFTSNFPDSNSMKFATIILEGSDKCALKLLARSILENTLGVKEKRHSQLSICRSNIRTVDDLWKLVASTVDDTVSTDMSREKIMDSALAIFQRDEDVVLCLEDLFNSNSKPSYEDIKRIKELIIKFWAEFSSLVEKHNVLIRQRLYIFVINEFCLEGENEGSLGITLDKTNSSYLIPVMPTAPFVNIQARSAIEDWSRRVGLENEMKKKYIPELSKYQYTKPLIRRICDIYSPNSFSYIERI